MVEGKQQEEKEIWKKMMAKDEVKEMKKIRRSDEEKRRQKHLK